MSNVSSPIIDQAREIVRNHGEAISDRIRANLVGEIVELAELMRSAERRRCADVCRERSELWARTIAADDSAPLPAREEARHRHNEARYLADALEVGDRGEGRSDGFGVN